MPRILQKTSRQIQKIVFVCLQAMPHICTVLLNQQKNHPMHTRTTLLCCLWAFLLFLSGNAISQNTISGTVRTPTGAPMPGVVVHISGDVNSFVISDALGHYAATLPKGGAYSLAPYSNAQPLNGVSTFDLVMISRHIDGVEPLDSPYKIIAADITNEGLIGLPDTVELRKLILGQITEFVFNTSWRFVRADYVFPNPTNPFQPPYPENYATPNLTADVTDMDFIGVKIGDINNSVIPVNLTDSTHLSWIDGIVAKDDNNNCQLDGGEPGLKNWVVRATGSFGNFFSKTKTDGTFSVAAPPGTYDVTLFPPNSLWDACTPTQTGITTILLGHTAVEFPAQVAIECPYMEVDLAAAFLRRCFPNNYSVSYCNQGTTTAEDAYVEVTFDSFLVVQNSSIPWTIVNGNTYTFPLGDVPSGECSSFRVTVLVSCDATFGQTHCSSAQIYPDTLCIQSHPLWSGANLEVTGQCNGDEVIFSIKNTGAAMTEAAGYVVIEDVMVQMSSGTVQLGAGASESITIPANGSSWRLEVQQAEYHPWSQLPSAMVEGCGTDPGGNFSTGFITQFPYGDERPTYDMDCQDNRASFDPNDKAGFPLGVNGQHFIPKGQNLTYKIRFQNTGTDTAFNIIVLDTLSSLLDLASLRVGASSHPYSYNLLDQGVLQFKFQNILLPDSNVNEALSHGFVQFTIAPRADLPDNSVLENAAAIYFDFNEPVLTNQTWHTIGEQYLNVSNVLFQPGIELEVFPNPTVERATFRLKSIRPLEGRLRLFDLQGRQVREQDFKSNVFDLDTRDLQPGMYFFRIDSGGGALAAGKIIKG